MCHFRKYLAFLVIWSPLHKTTYYSSALKSIQCSTGIRMQINETEWSLEINPNIHSQVILDKDGKAIQ